MNKTKLIVFVVIVFILIGLVGYLNFDKISMFFSNREWEIADSIGKIDLENYLGTFGTNSNFFVINGGEINGYSSEIRNVFKKDVIMKDVVWNSAGDFAIIAEKGSNQVYVINGNEEAWNSSINNASILSVNINKNGYSAVTYLQPGYKSLIKVYSSKGDELFTSYLASTYATDVSISNDNKILAIAEIDTSGVSLTSAIKLIDIQSAAESDVKRYELDLDELIVDIEYNKNNELVILTDSNAKILKNSEIKNLLGLKNENILTFSIANAENIVISKVEEESLFNSKCFLYIYDVNNIDNPKIYELEETPNNIDIMNDIIAVNTGNKIIFVNTNGNFVKKCEYSGQLKDIKLFNRGNVAALLFRDNAKLVKVGGI